MTSLQWLGAVSHYQNQHWLRFMTPYMTYLCHIELTPDSKAHGGNKGPTWALSGPDGPHVGPMSLAIRDHLPGGNRTYTEHEHVRHCVSRCLGTKRCIAICRHNDNCKARHESFKVPLVINDFKYVSGTADGISWYLNVRTHLIYILLSTHLIYIYIYIYIYT